MSSYSSRIKKPEGMWGILRAADEMIQTHLIEIDPSNFLEKSSGRDISGIMI
jgi:hypothetical protein